MHRGMCLHTRIHIRTHTVIDVCMYVSIGVCVRVCVYDTHIFIYVCAYAAFTYLISYYLWLWFLKKDYYQNFEYLAEPCVNSTNHGNYSLFKIWRRSALYVWGALVCLLSSCHRVCIHVKPPTRITTFWKAVPFWRVTTSSHSVSFFTLCLTTESGHHSEDRGEKFKSEMIATIPGLETTLTETGLPSEPPAHGGHSTAVAAVLGSHFHTEPVTGSQQTSFPVNSKYLDLQILR